MASFFLASRSTISVGASGAVFGLFSMAVLSKFRLHPKKLMECAVLGQFVVKQLVQVMLDHLLVLMLSQHLLSASICPMIWTCA